MRVLFTWVLGVFFVCCFAAHFTLSSLRSFATDEDAMLAVAKRSDLHQTVVNVVAESLEQELADNPDPAFRLFVGSASKSLIAGVLTDEWFYDVLGIAIGGAVRVFEGARENQRVDLRERKRALADALDELGDRGIERCKRVSGSRCQTDVTRVLRDYQAGVSDLLVAMPDETSLIALLEERGSKFLPDSANTDSLKRTLSTLTLIRWSLFISLFVLAGAMAWLSWSSFSRAATVVGLTLVVAAGTYLGFAQVAANQVDASVEKAFEDRARALGQSDAVIKVASEGAMRTARESVRSALGTKGLPVTVSLLCGFGLLAAGAAVRRR